MHNRLDKFGKIKGSSFEYSPFHCLMIVIYWLVNNTNIQSFSIRPPQEKKPLYFFIFNTSDQIPRSYTDREKHIISYMGKRL